MEGRNQKIPSTCNSYPKDRTASDKYGGVQTYIGITENSLTEVQPTEKTLLEEILSPSNLNFSYKQVVGNKGSGCIDRMGTEDLLPYLLEHKSTIVSSLYAGTYCPHPVRRVEIPKDNGKTRQLGIPTVVDRLIQLKF